MERSRRLPAIVTRRVALLLLPLAIALGGAACGADDRSTPATVPPPATAQSSSMNITLTVNGQVLAATLNDSPAARDFAAMLPLTLTLSDYNATEKVSDLPGALSKEGAPPSFDPSIGDITYFAPWGNLAIFYRDFQTSPGLISLGRIDGDVGRLAGPSAIEVTIKRADP